MRAFDNHKIMVLKMLSALNIRVYRNIGVLKLICENERTIADTFSDKNTCTDLNCLVKRKTGIIFYAAANLTASQIKMGFFCLFSNT